MHQRYFYSLCCIILRLQKEVIGSGLENTFQNHEKEHPGRDENNFFFYSILYFTTFFESSIFPFLQQFTAGENLRVAGDSAGRRRILTTLRIRSREQYFSTYQNNIFEDVLPNHFFHSKIQW